MSAARFQVVPVLDVLRGAAVHAVAGERSHYRPVRSVLHPGSDPLALGRAYRDRLGLTSLYVADLDAIQGAGPNLPLYRELALLGLALWIDAGLRDDHDTAGLDDLPHTSLVAGLETIRGPDALRRILQRVGPERLVFSIDLHGGPLRVASGASWFASEPLALGRELIDLGVRRLLLLDLARVGTGRGIGTEPLLRGLHALASPGEGLEISVGGGIAGIEEVAAARAAGAAAVLLGSALHDGRITPEMLDRLSG